MKKILLTGASGFIGRNILGILSDKYKIVTPNRQELDLKNSEAVLKYVRMNNIDIIVHSANPNPAKVDGQDKAEAMFEDSMRVFMSIYNVREYCEKIIYFGSGAEYDKTLDISSIREEDISRSLPKDVYGFSKYLMNELARSSDNIYNLRVFACFGPTDHMSKFITHIIYSCLTEQQLTIRQDCYFDFLHVHDLAKVLIYAIENKLKYHDYNVGSGKRYLLSEIAGEVRKQMCCNQEICILKKGLNKEYTPSIARLEEESCISDSFISLQEGISKQIEYERRALR